MRTEEILLKRLKERKMRFAGHVMRGLSGDLLNLILEGSIEGTMQSNDGSENNAGQPSSVDWGKFGLKSDCSVPVASKTWKSNEYHAVHSNENELFHQDQLSSESKPWWKTKLLLSEPILFGTWDGVFTSCFINIFGVIIFMRTGWMVGEAGIGLSVLIVLISVVVALISLLSAIGICDRCKVESGGVFFLVSHVLGSQLGGAIGIAYCFGQAVAISLYAAAFSESMTELMHIDDPWVDKGIAIVLVVLLVVINVAGVGWVVKIQFLLLLILMFAALDFAVGSFVRTDPKNGVTGYSALNFNYNSNPKFSKDNNWFTVFGVFFPTVTGVFAGINMSGDLRNPSRDIPIGSLAAVGTSTFLYLIFVLILGATCQREFLLSNFMIAEKVSSLRVLLLAGLYVSSISSTIATLYGTPRVLQSVANENIIPSIKFLGKGRGPNKNPIVALAVIAVISLIFIMVGEMNTLGPIVTMPFLLTYAVVDYAYFSLAMTFNMQKKRDARFSRHSSLRSFGSATFDQKEKDLLQDDGNDVTGYGSTALKSALTSPDDHSSILSVDSANDLRKKDIEKSRLIAESDKQWEITSKPSSWYSSLCNRWLSLLGLTCQLYIVGTSPSRSTVDIKATVEKHSGFVKNILAAHTLSGCDTVASLYGIGKTTVSVDKDNTARILPRKAKERGL
ncbi:Solute carrier family 12 member 8 [Nymphon striatum]|nr:Solute carrier family 12 member 8 [Nymphon striatum]